MAPNKDAPSPSPHSGPDLSRCGIPWKDEHIHICALELGHKGEHQCHCGKTRNFGKKE